MAELTPATSACCRSEQRATCCDPTAKADCCGEHGEGCGCEGAAKGPAQRLDVRERVRERYAIAAREARRWPSSGEPTATPDSAPSISTRNASGQHVFGSALYDRSEAAEPALAASLGCGVPTAVADLKAGEIVLDLGSGAGADVLISARRVGPTGKAIGLDMTDEMLTLARSNAQRAGVRNVEFLKGYIEAIPLPDASVDVVISNCVLNLSGEKAAVLREAARVLRPEGRFAISDVVADEDMDDETRADMQKWTGCIAGALTRREFERALADAGFVSVDIRETHRVHDRAAAAIVRARKPSGAA